MRSGVALARDQLRGPPIRRRARRTAGDLAWSLPAILGASALYLLTIYSDSWGSLDDLLTAFTAGFGTAIAIDWAAVPIFQSLRLRKSA
jgi:hypothetical protein